MTATKLRFNFRSKAIPMKTKLVTLLCLLSAASCLRANDWPQWRGPQRDGQVTGSAWPDRLGSNQLQQIWRVELGPSYSGPVVVGDRVFTTETKDKKLPE